MRNLTMSACRCHPPLAATTAITPRYWNSDTFEGQLSPTSRDPENTSKIPLVLFCHANGFCKDIWKPVADELSAFAIAPFRWISMDFSGHGSSRKIRTGGTIDWQFAVEDVSEVLNEYRDGAPVVGVGHSMGATALLMSSLASREDDMGLRLLVLFEPILFPTSKSDNSFTDALCQSALRRRHTWTSSEEAQAYLAMRPVFRRFDPRAVAAYARGGTLANADGSGVTLACDPEDEAALYRDGPRILRRRIHEVQGPCHVVAGQLSLPPMDSAYFRRLAQTARMADPPDLDDPGAAGRAGGDARPAAAAAAWGFEEVPGCCHLLVMENPRAAAAAVAGAAGRAGLPCFRVRGSGEVDCGP